MELFKKHTGIIIKSFLPKQHKVALIDSSTGRIDAAFYSSTILTGSLVSYAIEQKKGAYLINNLTVENIPLSLAQIDILFFHHVLELCYYFIPIGSCISGIFELLHYLCAIENITYTRQFKKIFLLKLIVTIGYYPESSKFHEQEMQTLLTLPIDRMAHEQIDLSSEAIVDDWLCKCIAQHPYVESFNTVHFLIKNRTT